jgi:hypothetical protein
MGGVGFDGEVEEEGLDFVEDGEGSAIEFNARRAEGDEGEAGHEGIIVGVEGWV